MRVRDLMTRDVITLSRAASLKEAARRMIEAGVSGLVVTGDAGQVEGVITEADFVKTEADRRATKRARLLRWFGQASDVPSVERRVEDVMTKEVVTAGPDADHAEVARLMQQKGIKRVPILEEGRLVGIVSRGDILRAFARADAEIIAEIEEHVMGEVLWVDPRRVVTRSVDGNVSLGGRLETKSDAVLLEDLAKRVDGVVSVHSTLTWDIDNTRLEMVSPPPNFGRRANW